MRSGLGHWGCKMHKAKLKVAVLDMQPIDPPVGGGRLRLLGLYHALGPDIEATYVGTYDWRGEQERDQMLSDNLREVLVPLSDAHFAAAKTLKRQARGRTVIDSAFHQHVHLSPEFLRRARAAVQDADVIVYSHPWLYPPTADLLDRTRQTLVYDAHNVEGKLRMALLDGAGAGTKIVREVVRIERMLCRAADLVLACSAEDASAFCRLYGTDPARLRVVPNGAFTERDGPRTPETVSQARRKLGIAAREIAIFLGSAYNPNVEAARFITKELAQADPETTYVIAGGVGQAISKFTRGNVIVTGQLSEDMKQTWLSAADIAINPMMSGSGTNIKMLDFMAAGLPVVATPIGARGLIQSANAFCIAQCSGFAATVRDLMRNSEKRQALAASGLQHVKRHYSWERISPHLGRILQRHQARLGRRPRISVVIPSYERHDKLTELIDCLSRQDMRDFEVIIIDQSKVPWPDAASDHGIDLCYVHTDIKGAVFARNRGSEIATGEIIAFTDDDCLPHTTWLSAALERFDAAPIIGLEGLVRSCKYRNRDWRPVTNKNFEGVGFMTANLFVRSDAFHAIGGFDIAFENPHFREDTDLGWRLLELGAVPFSHEAWVFHPPHPRSVDRESLSVRSRFFVNDAKLMAKHPDRYVELFLAERQWVSNPHFMTWFHEGVRLAGVDVPDKLASILRAKGLEMKP